MQMSQNIGKGCRIDTSSLGTELIGMISVFILASTVLGARTAAEHVRNALDVCISGIVPSVFPLMVISNLLSLGSGGMILNRVFGGVIHRVFGISKNAAVAVLLGFLCGFPVGAGAAARLYEGGYISRDDMCRLLTFVNNPGAPFVIYAVGGALLGSAKIGIIIYICVVLSSVIAGVLSGIFMKHSVNDSPPPSAPAYSLSDLTVTSIRAATAGILNVCACAAFFSATVGVLSKLLERLGVPSLIRCSLFAVFELVGGTAALAASENKLFAILSVASACSWSGLSVMMQIVSVCGGKKEPPSFAPMILSKLFQAILCPILLLLCLKLTQFAI